MSKYYVTTPIYYPSGKFHIGTAYTTVLADMLKRLRKMQGYDCLMLTGVDEHGQKIEDKAKDANMSPQEYVWDDIVMLVKEFVSIFPQTKDKIKPEDIKDLRASEILEKMKMLSNEAYKEFEIETVNSFNEVMSKYYGENYVIQEPFRDDNIVRNVEKDILLQVVDAKWIDHLGNIDMLKDSIGLVAYGQKDPLIEYKKEAYNYFNALMGEIQSETVQHLFRAKFGVQVVQE